MIIRFSKTILIAALALFFAIVAFNNVTDYGSNFSFVQHVLGMDTTFPGNTLKWRAITTPWVHHVFYAGIIACETTISVLLAIGAWKLWLARSATSAEFQQAKAIATAGLTLSLLLWFGAFLTIGGEWFVMWQSQIWNGQTAAARMFEVTGVILIYLSLKEE
jgi:predicted small integral membrane protein